MLSFIINGLREVEVLLYGLGPVGKTLVQNLANGHLKKPEVMVGTTYGLRYVYYLLQLVYPNLLHFPPVSHRL